MNYKNKYIKYKLKYLNLIKTGGKSKRENDKKKIKTGGKSKREKEKDKKKIKTYKQIFKKNLKDINYIKIEITPSLKYYNEEDDDDEDNGASINLQDMDNKLKKLFIKKLNNNHNETITEGLLYNNEIIKYKYDKNTNIISVYIKPDVNLLINNFESWIIHEENPYELIDILKLYSWHYYYEMEQGEQHYKDGDDYIKKNEYDKYSYILDVKLYSASLYYNNKQKFHKYKRIDNNGDDDFDKTFLFE